MNIRKLYKGSEYIIVNLGSAKEKDLLALGWQEYLENNIPQKEQYNEQLQETQETGQTETRLNTDNAQEQNQKAPRKSKKPS